MSEIRDKKKQRQGKKKAETTDGLPNQMRDALNRLGDRVKRLEQKNDSAALMEAKQDTANMRFVLQNMQSMANQLAQVNGQLQQMQIIYNTQAGYTKSFLEANELFETYTTYVETESKKALEEQETASETV